MSRSSAVPAFVVLLLVFGCSSPERVGSFDAGVWTWPDEPRPHRIELSFAARPAQTALAYLAAPDDDPALLAAAVESTVESGVMRAFSVDRDGYRAMLQAARDPDRPSRLAGAARRAGELLAAVEIVERERAAIEAEIVRRALWLLPDQPELDFDYRVVVAIGVEEFVAVQSLPVEAGNGVLIDPSRALTDLEQESAAALIDLVARSTAPDLFALARSRSDPFPTPIEEFEERDARLVERLHREGPKTYLSFSADFLPIGRWLKKPLDRVWSRFRNSVENPPKEDERDPLAVAERPGFWERDVGLVGASMVDAIALTFGAEECRRVVAADAEEFVRVYDLAARRDGNLPRLPKRLRKDDE